MRSLYLRIWITVVASLALFALVSGWLVQRHLGQERAHAEAVLSERVAAWGELMQRALPPEPRGAEIGVPFGPVVAVGADATPYEALVGWLGRNPEWTRA